MKKLWTNLGIKPEIVLLQSDKEDLEALSFSLDSLFWCKGVFFYLLYLSVI
jgi:hypothetical protein